MRAHSQGWWSKSKSFQYRRFSSRNTVEMKMPRDACRVASSDRFRVRGLLHKQHFLIGGEEKPLTYHDGSGHAMSTRKVTVTSGIVASVMLRTKAVTSPHCVRASVYQLPSVLSWRLTYRSSCTPTSVASAGMKPPLPACSCPSRFERRYGQIDTKLETRHLILL